MNKSNNLPNYSKTNQFIYQLKSNTLHNYINIQNYYINMPYYYKNVLCKYKNV